MYSDNTFSMYPNPHIWCGNLARTLTSHCEHAGVPAEAQSICGSTYVHTHAREIGQGTCMSTGKHNVRVPEKKMPECMHSPDTRMSKYQHTSRKEWVRVSAYIRLQNIQQQHTN